MKTPVGPGASALSRRQLLLTAGTGIGALTLGGAGFVGAPLVAQEIQIGGTPPAAPVPTPAPPSGETVAGVAARLNYDTGAIFAFVRDEIHYESYAGVLRGARGTLWARAGNDADQAVLLGELFAAAQTPYRFAIGPLEGAGADALAAHLTRSTAEASLPLDEAIVAASLHALNLTDVAELEAAAANGQDVLDRFGESGQAAIELSEASLASSQTAIAGALAEAGIELPPLDPPRLTDRELNQHAWIQVAAGPDWIDYDPSPPGDMDAAAPGSPFETPDALPDDWRHHLKIAIAADDYFAGALSRREVVAFTTTSDQVVNIPIAVSLAAPDELTDLGLTLTELFTGQKSIFPSIYADGVTVDADQPLVFATGETTAQDPFGGVTEGVAEGETVAVWMVLEVTSPDAAPVVVERALLDRIPAEDRASGLIVPGNVTPVTLVSTILGEQTVAQLNVLPVIHIDVARLPVINAADKVTQDTIFSSLGLLGPALASFRDDLGQQEEAQNGYWSYPSAPNVTVFHIAPPAAGETDATTTISVDLLYRHRTSLPLADVEPSPTVHPLVLSGVLDAVAEQALLAPETRGGAGDTSAFATGPTVGDLFAAAVDSGQAVRVLTSVADLAGIDADAASTGYLTAALDLGLYVVVPEAPVEVAGEPFLGWWIIDPATGRTRDQLQNGMASASTTLPARSLAALQELAEYSFLNRAVSWIVANAVNLACLAMGISVGAFSAMMVIHASRGAGAGTIGADAALGGIAGGVAGAAGC